MVKFKNILRVLVTGSFTMILSACYGVMARVPLFASLKVTNSKGEGIPDLKVSYKDDLDSKVWIESGTTDSLGSFEFIDQDSTFKEYQFKIEDTDGDKNLGKFVSKIVSTESTNNTIILEEEN